MAVDEQLTAIITSLIAGDANRFEAETQLTTVLLPSAPHQLLLALINLGANSPEVSVRTLAFVLYRRLAFQPLPSKTPVTGAEQDVWDGLDDRSKAGIKAGLLRAVANDLRGEKERQVVCDAVAATQNAGEERQESWPELSVLLSTLFASPLVALRESTFKIYAECTSLLASQPIPLVIQGLKAGLKDESVSVKLAALAAGVELIKGVPKGHLVQFVPLVGSMLEILPPLVTARSEARLTTALISLIDLASTPSVPSRLFKPHMLSIIQFSLAIVRPSPYPSSPDFAGSEEGATWDESVRTSALELLLSLAETAPALCGGNDAFVSQVVPVCLHLMCERVEDEDWLKQTGFQDDDEEDGMGGIAVAGEGALDRIAVALNDKVFKPFAKELQAMLESPHWQVRHAGFSAIAAVAEGCVDNITEQLSELVQLVLRGLKDPHPRVRYSAVYASGQLCTDLEGQLQDEHGPAILVGLMGVMTGTEPRLQAYAAAACVNFLQFAESKSVLPVLPQLFAHLLGLLSGDQSADKIFVKENAIEALTLLAGCMEEEFTPLYPGIMPQLIYLLESSVDESLMGLRAKALDCAASIADAVDSSVFAPDATRLLTALHKIQSTLNVDQDPTTERYLLRAYAQLAAVVGPDAFAPYIQDALPRLVEVAQRVTPLTHGDAEDEEEDEDEEWETVQLENGDRVAIKTSALQEKSEAVQNLVILVQAIGKALSVDALKQIMQVAVPLLKFYLSIEVRESAAILVQVCVSSLAKHELTPEDRQAVLNAAATSYTENIAAETDSSILSVLLASFSASIVSLPHCLSLENRQVFLKALEGQLVLLGQREKERLESAAEDEDDWVDADGWADEDATVFEASNNVIKNLLQQDGEGFPVGPLLPFLGWMTGASEAATHFALRLFSDIAEFNGAGALASIGTYQAKVLGAVVASEPVTRRIAAFAVGAAVEGSPAAFAEFGIAAIEPLFSVIGSLESEDQTLLAARDNAVSALSKIIRNLGDQGKLPVDELLARWVPTLPVIVDGAEMTPVNGLLLELIARGHPSVSPTSAQATHVLKCLVAALQNEVLPHALHKPVAQALKTYVGSMDGGATIDIPADIQAKVVALLE